jgi:NodT family efflux transporter outer membrane factor (OMF) lipoprotein
VGPKYTKPTTQIPPAYKELANWKPAEPSDHTSKGNWWDVFNDPQLNVLEQQLLAANQTLRAAQDSFLQARAAVRISRSAQYPTANASAAYSRNRLSPNRATAGAAIDYNDFIVTGSDIPYEIDVWGRVRMIVQSSRAQAQASAADLETVRLSLTSTLASFYYTLRGLDAQKQLLDSTVISFEKALELAQNRFRGGLASLSDVELATTLLEQTRAQDIDITSSRNQFEHAIAVLVGQPASSFSLPETPMPTAPPSIPTGLPSELLERRPDIASAERRVDAANAIVGVSRAAYFPLFTLGLAGGFESSSITNWLTNPRSMLGSVAGSAFETVFDAGRRRAISDQAKASYDQTIAGYQQAVLLAYQQVEDSLVDLRVLEQESKVQDAAVAAAQRSLDQSINRYRGGIDTYLVVITAQNAALANQRTAVTLLTRRFTSSVFLVKALGGGWDVSKMPVIK